MSTRVVSPFFVFLIQLFFGLLTLGGGMGLWWIWAVWPEYKKEERENLLWIFVILFGSLIAVGVRGFLYARAEKGGLQDDPDLVRMAAAARLSPRRAWSTVFAGLTLCALGAGLTVLSPRRPSLTGGHNVFFGAMIVGAVQALAGASQLALARRRASQKQA
jgi:hypothetical protein